MEIKKDMTIFEVLQAKPQTAQAFLDMGMRCLGCPAARGETVAQAAATHGVDADELVRKLNEA